MSKLIAVLFLSLATAGAYGQVTPISDEFRVDTEPPRFPRHPSAAISGDRAFIVVWDGGRPHGIQARRYDRAGNALGPQFQLSDSSTYELTPAPVAMHANGDFVAAWSGPGYGVRLDASTRPARHVVAAFASHGPGGSHHR